MNKKLTDLGIDLMLLIYKTVISFFLFKVVLKIQNNFVQVYFKTKQHKIFIEKKIE